MGWGSLGLARADTGNWRWVMCPAHASLGEKLRDHKYTSRKISRDCLGPLLGTFTHGSSRPPKASLTLGRKTQDTYREQMKP